MTGNIAITGATGFVGAETLEQALAAEWQVSALTRRAQPPRAGLTWVPGSLEDDAALDRLVRDADVVLHIAGMVNAPDRAGFEAGNALGTMAVIDAMRRQGVRRLVHVSSLAARQPDLSDYGWSKAMAERHVKASGLDWTIVRPPAIYGPGDREMLDLFRMAKRRVMLLPPAGRLSVIEVSDLARLLLILTGETEASMARTYEVDDGTPNGWDHKDFAQAIAAALGDRPVRALATPRWVLAAGASVDRFFRGKGAKLTPDRVRYFCHPDWVVQKGKQPPGKLWKPQVETFPGLQATVEAYRAKGWL
ncbi:MAG: NAD-dependent epimerase/dehydratase family protein [Sphingobium sp.]